MASEVQLERFERERFRQRRVEVSETSIFSSIHSSLKLYDVRGVGNLFTTPFQFFAELRAIKSFCRAILFNYKGYKLSPQQKTAWLKAATAAVMQPESPLSPTDRIVFFEFLVRELKHAPEAVELKEALNNARESLKEAQLATPPPGVCRRSAYGVFARTGKIH